MPRKSDEEKYRKNDIGSWEEGLMYWLGCILFVMAFLYGFWAVTMGRTLIKEAHELFGLQASRTASKDWESAWSTRWFGVGKLWRRGERMNKLFDLICAIKLEDAHFCLNCGTVTNCSDTCPVCGHTYLWSLQPWLSGIYGSDFSRNGKLNLNGI